MKIWSVALAMQSALQSSLQGCNEAFCEAFQHPSGFLILEGAIIIKRLKCTR